MPKLASMLIWGALGIVFGCLLTMIVADTAAYIIKLFGGVCAF